MNGTPERRNGFPPQKVEIVNPSFLKVKGHQVIQRTSPDPPNLVGITDLPKILKDT